MTTATQQRLVVRAKEIVAAELERYIGRTANSQRATGRARAVIPLGVPSSFQAYDPHPIVAARARDSWLEDIDGHRYVDFNMGFGALYVGHANSQLRAALVAQLDDGLLYVTPCESGTTDAELLRQRFAMPQWRFTNSGTEATMDAIRVARGYTRRTRIVKVEGGYHGHHDAVLVSMKPSLADAGPAHAPIAVPGSEGMGSGVLSDITVIAFNDADALEAVLRRGDVAAFIVEPVMENIGICLPQPGYLEAVRALCTEYGTALIFDEVKTGITAGWGGATGRFGVQPDLVCLAKSIGGGIAVGAFGGRQEMMDTISDKRVVHQGTYNGNPLSMAAVRATLGTICTPEVMNATAARNERMLSDCQEIIERHDLPAHTVEMGAKGCVTWSAEPVHNYRDYKATDFDVAYAQWIWGINRGIMLPPGLDEQWLISVLHTDADVDVAVAVFDDFVGALTS